MSYIPPPRPTSYIISQCICFSLNFLYIPPTYPTPYLIPRLCSADRFRWSLYQIFRKPEKRARPQPIVPVVLFRRCLKPNFTDNSFIPKGTPFENHQKHVLVSPPPIYTMIQYIDQYYSLYRLLLWLFYGMYYRPWGARFSGFVNI